MRWLARVALTLCSKRVKIVSWKSKRSIVVRFSIWMGLFR